LPLGILPLLFGCITCKAQQKQLGLGKESQRQLCQGGGNSLELPTLLV